jgi:hypothetical protein
MTPNISPVQVHPKANCLYVQPGPLTLSGKDTLPTVNWVVGFLVPGQDAVPAKGTPGHDGYVAEVPAVAPVFTQHSSGTYTLSKAEWQAWDSAKVDIDYLTSLVAKALNFTLV